MEDLRDWIPVITSSIWSYSDENLAWKGKAPSLVASRLKKWLPATRSGFAPLAMHTSPKIQSNLEFGVIVRVDNYRKKDRGVLWFWYRNAIPMGISLFLSKYRSGWEVSWRNASMHLKCIYMNGTGEQVFIEACVCFRLSVASGGRCLGSIFWHIAPSILQLATFSAFPPYL